jgi:hypothetical protein
VNFTVDISLDVQQQTQHFTIFHPLHAIFSLSLFSFASV